MHTRPLIVAALPALLLLLGSPAAVAAGGNFRLRSERSAEDDGTIGASGRVLDFITVIDERSCGAGELTGALIVTGDFMCDQGGPCGGRNNVGLCLGEGATLDCEGNSIRFGSDVFTGVMLQGSELINCELDGGPGPGPGADVGTARTHGVYVGASAKSAIIGGSGITGFDLGIFTARNSVTRIEDTTSSSNRKFGLLTVGEAMLRNVEASSNVRHGIVAEGKTTLFNFEARDHSWEGIALIGAGPFTLNDVTSCDNDDDLYIQSSTARVYLQGELTCNWISRYSEGETTCTLACP